MTIPKKLKRVLMIEATVVLGIVIAILLCGLRP